MKTLVCPSCAGKKLTPQNLPCPTCRGYGKIAMTADAYDRLIETRRSFAGMGADPEQIMVESVSPCPTPTDQALRNTVDYLLGQRPQSMFVDTPTLINQGGGVRVNANKDYQDVIYMPAVQGSDTFPAALTAALPSDNLAMTAYAQDRDQGDVELAQLMGYGDAGRFDVVLTQSDLDRTYMNSAISDRLFFGLSFAPAMLGQTLYVPATAVVNFKVQNRAAQATNNVRIVGQGRRFRQPASVACRERSMRQETKRDSHFYMLGWDDGSAVQLSNVTTVQTYYMTVPSGAYFECFGIMDDSDGDYDVNIVKGQNGQSIMSNGVRLPARSMVMSPSLRIQGVNFNLNAAANPFNWQYSMIFKPNTKIRFDMVNQFGATNNVRACMWGRLLYYPLSA